MKKKCGVIILPDNRMQEIDSVLNVPDDYLSVLDDYIIPKILLEKQQGIDNQNDGMETQKTA